MLNGEKLFSLLNKLIENDKDIGETLEIGGKTAKLQALALIHLQQKDLELQKTQLELAQSDLKNSELTEMTNKRINDLVKWLKTYRPFTSDEYAEFQANADLDKI